MSDKIWVRALIYHSYHNVLREPDSFYEVDNEQDLETVTAHRVAVRDNNPPAKARRAPVAAVTPPAATPTQPRTGAAPVAPLTTTTFTVGNVPHGARKK